MGSSEVCAAVSGLMYALAGYLVNAERDGKVQVICSKMMPGEAEQRWEGSEAEDAAYNLVVIGLMQIAGSYPQYLEIGEG